MNIGIELFTVAIEVFLPWYFFSGMLGKSGEAKHTKITTAILYSAALALLSTVFSFLPAKSFLVMICTYLAAKFYFHKSWASTFYVTVLFFLFAVISDILCGTILQLSGVSTGELMGQGIDRLIYNTLGKLMHLLCLYMILTVSTTKIDAGSIVKSLPLISCLALSIFICQQNYLLVISGAGSDFLRFETVGIMYINLVICAFVDTLNRSHAREREAEASRQQLELQQNYYQDIMERQEETRRLWHDIKKYMLSMEALVTSENREEAQACLDSIQSMFSGAVLSIDTGNSLVNSIFTYVLKRADEHDVTIRPDIWVDQRLNFPAQDLFVIIGNTLDNAIEACGSLADSARRIIDVTLKQQNHVLLYEVCNPCVDKQMHKPGKIHGYGMKNVRTCVENAGGAMSVSNKGGLFTVSIQLNLGE